jgi:hypothetical protein
MEDAARAEANGVAMIVQANHWKGEPSNLRAALLPMYIDMRNNSGHPLQVAYRRFTLLTGTGFETTALPPFRIQGSVPQTRPVTVVNPWYGWSGFHLAPYYSPFYGSAFHTWGGPWYFDSPYYTAYATWQQPLPTEDMLAKALPEGVLQNGGNLTGYLYFRRLPEGADRVTFRSDLIDAETEQQIASLNVPFVIED